MEFESWQQFYQSDLQGFTSLIVVPALFFVYLLVGRGPRERADGSDEARFVRTYALVFCAETICDPLFTGPVTKALELGDTASSVLMIPFVLLGDFRVLLPVFFLAGVGASHGQRAFRAAALTLLVPAFAVSVDAVIGWLRPDLDAQFLWIVYELAFLTLALTLRHRFVPRWTADRPDLGRRLRALLSYAATYYALWAASDLLIFQGGVDAGWLLRALPNQLYYAFWVPFAYWTLSREF